MRSKNNGNWLFYCYKIKLKIDDETDRKIQFADSICTCKSRNHAIASDYLDASCTCCRECSHSMVLDGMEGFSS
jgi:hypothetical protein